MKYENKRVIGITGGIGSGKSMVLELLMANYDALIIEADKIGHKVQKPGEEVYEQIIDTFGEDILEEPCKKGISNIDRKKLGQIVFADNEQLKRLNAITHPAIHKRIDSLIKGSKKHFVVIEAAILTETSLVELTDELWYIHATKEVKLERLQTYRGIDEKRALMVMKNQPDEEYFRKKCHAIIDNSGSRDNTLNQIKNILDKI